MNDTEFIKKFINQTEIEANRYSCLMIALTDARKITGRDCITGEYKLDILSNECNFLNPYSFIGIINYLLILDMVGEIFKAPKFSGTKQNNIYKALKQFSSLKDNDIDACIALRNSLAHNYGLINIPKQSKEYLTKRHKFTLDNRSNANLIEYPSIGQSWSGDFKDKFEKSSTKVGYIKMCDLIEEVYNDIKTKAEKDLIVLALKEGIVELKARFTIRN